ncbi:MAG TPA: methyltransferase domain-containing protein [Chitinophagaceae bacterium]|nr:methyltransferase domain-containing protein [Chitinophagaceae bacterium]
MLNWNHRSDQKELLDRTDIPFLDIKKNMAELDIINSRLGGHAITIKGLQTILKNNLFQNPISILEIGCGGGDNLRVLKRWAAKKNIPVQLTGVDINEACIQFANEQQGNAGIQFICADYKTVTLQQDVIFSSLFCHHFTDSELVNMLQWMKEYAAVGFFINDLHRHPAAYYSIRLLTGLFSKSYLVKNDAPLSVLRGFTKGEWIKLFQKAMLPNYIINWKWAFRWLITYTV